MDFVRRYTGEKSLKAIIGPIAVLVGLTVFVAVSAYLFFQNEKAYVAHRSEMVAQTVASGLKNEIQSRIAMLTMLAKAENEDILNTNYENVAKIAMENFSAFFALNYVSPAGIIEKVYPREQNLLALGRDLIKRPAVVKYLLDARDLKAPQMSHRIMTYQQIYAFVLYIPIFDESDTFRGWINGVIDFDSWLLSYLASRNLSNTRVRIRWENSPDSMIDQGNANQKDLYHYNYQLLNQRIYIDVGFSKSPSEQLRTRFYFLMLIVGSILLFLIAYFYVKMALTKNRLALVNSQLFLKNSLLSSVTHDISNPLLALNLNLESLLHGETATFTPLQKQKALRALKRIGEMLNGARRMHAQNMGLGVIGTQPVDLYECLQDALIGIHDYAESKPVKFEVVPLTQKIFVKAEPKTLINNVLANVLTNAVKFSPPAGVVKIKITYDDSCADLIIEDQGRGLSETQIKQFEKLEFLESQSGTHLEQGTGLGLLQIKTFMQAYGGALSIRNSASHGAVITLRFSRTTESDQTDQQS